MDPSDLLNPIVLVYLAVVVGTQAGLGHWRRRRQRVRAQKRRDAGLPDDVLLNTATRLGNVRQEALTDAAVLVGTVVVAPFVLWLLTSPFDGLDDARDGLGLVFAGLLIWLLFTATDVGRAFFGGIAFRTLLAFTRPFQVGDRVTLNGHAGKVVSIGVFHVGLVTPDDDLVSIPSATLWSEPLVSANAGDRASLTVSRFYLAPFATREQRQMAENAIWDALQTSVYFDFSKPLQIYLEQTQDAIVLTAKAYVSDTYDEPVFKSDVARSFLDWAAENGVPLASTRWRESPKRTDDPASAPEEGESAAQPGPGAG